MWRKPMIMLPGLMALVLAGCSSSPPTTAPSGGGSPAAATPAATSTSTPTTPQSQAPTQAPSGSLPTGVPTSLDPCVLVTSQEASQLTGASFGAGRESTTSGNGRLCTYGYQTLNVFTVLVGQAPDVATAQAGKEAAQASLEKIATKGVKVTELPNFADGAAVLEASGVLGGQTFSASAIYVLKGTIFFAISDLVVGHAAPSSAALQSEATTALGRLP